MPQLKNPLSGISQRQKNILACFLSGSLFSMGWWFMADANAISNLYQFTDRAQVNGVHYVPAIFSTLAMILLNAIPRSSFDDPFSDMENNIKLLLLFGFLMAFGSLFGAIYIFADVMANPPSPSPTVLFNNPDGNSGKTLIVWPATAVFLQNLLIFSSNMI